MMFRTLLASAALTLGAAPVLAHDKPPVGDQAGAPVPAGCQRVHAHVPAGKIVHAAAPIRCGESSHEIARASHPRAPLAAPRTERD